MIIILCETYDAAKGAYTDFVRFLDRVMPWCITCTKPLVQAVWTDEDLIYHFIDRRMKPFYDTLKRPCDFIDEEEFFDGLAEFYAEEFAV